MANQALISLAVLKTNSNRGKDVYDNFVPLISDCIRNITHDVISVPQIKGEMERHFCISIPQHVIDTILIRLRNQGFIEINKRNATVTPTLKLREDEKFQRIRQETIRKHELLLQDLINFSHEKHSYNWSIEEAESALLSFLDEFQISLLENVTKERVIPFEVSTNIPGKYLVGQYIKHLIETYSSNLEYLETVTKGFMLANAMYLPNPSTATRKFRQTRVYFDTTFLIYAIGYSGTALQEPCRELLNMLYETGAELRCFKHTLEEIRAVLENTAALIARNRIEDASKVAAPNIEHFISIRATPADVKQYIVMLEKSLKALRIQVEETPAYNDYKNMIDETVLGETLGEKVNYRNIDGNALQRDIQSIASIIRIRGGRNYQNLEDSKAVFVTSNPRLFRASSDFYYRTSHMVGIAPCITDHMMTNMIWLKAPLKAPDLPMKVILADCFAAAEPNPELWRAYLKEVDKLHQQDEITQDDYYLLRYEVSAKQILMEKTLGEEGAFTQGTITEILDAVRLRYTESIAIELQTAQETISMQNKATATKQEIVRNRALRWSAKICIGIKSVIFLVLFVCNLLGIFFSVHRNTLGYWILGVSILSFIYTVVDLWKNIFIELRLRALENKIAKFLENKILQLSGEIGS